MSTMLQTNDSRPDLTVWIPKAIKAVIRERQGWTLQRLAEETEITYNTLCNHLKGLSGGLTLDEIAAITDRLDMSLAKLEQLALGEAARAYTLST